MKRSIVLRGLRQRTFYLLLTASTICLVSEARGQRANDAGSGSQEALGSLSKSPVLRRVVTGTNAAGKSTVIFDGVPPTTLPRNGGGGNILLWIAHSTPADNSGNRDAAVGTTTSSPSNDNETVFKVVEWPPGEGLEGVPEAGMHHTKTIDYVVILSGEIGMRLQDDSEVRLKAGDILVQRGVVHGWRNRTNQPCRAAIVMVPAKD